MFDHDGVCAAESLGVDALLIGKVSSVVHGVQAVEQLAQGRTQRFVREVLVGETCVAAERRDLARDERGYLGRRECVRRVGMPGLGDGMDLEDHHHPRVALDVRHVRMLMDLAPPCGEVEVLLLGYLATPDAQHVMMEEGLVQ